jgi:hypothetical protein
MLHKTAFFRAIAIPACLVWGVFELYALQRSRLLSKRGHMVRRPQHVLRENA